MELPSSVRGTRLRAIALATQVWAIGAVGVLMSHHPMIFSGFRRIQTNLADSRFNHYVLEHGYLWIRGVEGHREFWNPPFFYPVSNVIAYSDPLLGVGPCYWLWRCVGLPEDMSFGLWMVTTSVLNYAAGFLLFRKGLGLDRLPSAIGSFLIAFGAPRVNQMEHQQLLPCFYIISSIYALARLFGGHPSSRRLRWGYWLLAALGVVLQFYSGMYLALFLCAILTLSSGAALVLPSCRGVLFEVVRRDRWAIVAAATAAWLLMQPILTHYRPVADQVAHRQYAPMYRALHPRLSSWLSLGKDHWLWGWTDTREPFRSLPSVSEHHLGIGFVTPLLCAAGLYLGRGWRVCRLAALVMFLTWFATNFWPGDKLAAMALVVCVYCLAGLFRETEHAVPRGIGLAAVTGLLLIVQIPSTLLQVLALVVIFFCLLELARGRENPAGWIFPGTALLFVCLKLFAPLVIWNGILLVAPLVGLAATYGALRQWQVALGLLSILLLFIAVVTYLDDPTVLLGALAAAPLALVATIPRLPRPPASLITRALVVALFVMTLFYHHDSLWLTFHDKIPGAIGLRAIGRIVLIMLLPYALGLAALIQFLNARQHAAWGWIVAGCCMLEQGVTTETFDSATNRASIARVAEQVDPGREAFYYHPPERQPFFRYQLDAMWASILVGLPTINGYSGYFPPSWDGFFLIDFDRDIDLRQAASEWERANGLSHDRIQWTGLDFPREEPLHSEDSPSSRSAQETPR
jgi:hypothetical protein